MRSNSLYAAVAQSCAGLRLLVIALVLAAYPAPGSMAQVVFASNGRDVNVERFNEQVTRLMQEVGVPGMSLAVIDNNRVVFYNAYGVRKQGDPAKVDKSTVFNGCSLSKSFLAFVAYQLAGEGKLDLDKPMHQYLENERLKHDPRYKLITPRLILSHSSGIENWWYQNNREQLEILSTPGEKYVYSGEGYHYLAQVIETLLKQPYEVYVRQRVIEPLQLTNTYLKYEQKNPDAPEMDVPANNAVGHEIDGRYSTLKNYRTVPAAGNHFTAEDYAKLILATFDPARISPALGRDITQQIIRIGNSSVYYGPGFEVIYTKDDTIVSHGGDDTGFKNLMFYSVAKKRGMVFLTNSDRGKSMAAQLNEMTVNLDLAPFFAPQYYYLNEQYPSAALQLLKVRDQKGYDGMLAEVEKWKKERKIDNANTLNVVSGFFMGYGGDRKVARKLLEDNVKLHPDSPLAYCLLGNYYLDADEYSAASTHYIKAKELNFDLWDIDKEIKDCENKLADAERRKTLLVNIDGAEAAVEAEGYNAMKGVRLQTTSDEGGGQHVGFIDAEDWMDYRVNVSTTGTYSVTFRVASMKGGGQILLRSGTQVLATVEVGPTNAWTNWTTLTTKAKLPKGAQTITLYAASGGFALNRITFSLVGAK